MDEIARQSKILVVDDDLFSIKIIESILQNEFKEIHNCNEGQEVTNFCYRIQPDIILLDWNLEDTDGLNILKELKENPDLNQIPVIIITGEKKESIFLNHALNHGAVDFLRKPLDNFELIARVKSAVHLAYLLKETTIGKEKLETLISLLINDLQKPFQTILDIVDKLSVKDLNEEDEKEAFRRLKSISVNRIALITDLLNSQGINY